MLSCNNTIEQPPHNTTLETPIHESDSGESLKSDVTLDLENSFVPLPKKSVLVSLESLLIKPQNCGSVFVESSTIPTSQNILIADCVASSEDYVRENTLVEQDNDQDCEVTVNRKFFNENYSDHKPNISEISSKVRYPKKRDGRLRKMKSLQDSSSSSVSNNSNQSERSRSSNSSRKEYFRFRSQKVSYYKVRTVKSDLRKTKVGDVREYSRWTKEKRHTPHRRLLAMRPEQFSKSHSENISQTDKPEDKSVEPRDTPDIVKCKQALANEYSIANSTEISTEAEYVSNEFRLESFSEKDVSNYHCVQNMTEKPTECQPKHSESSVTIKEILNTPIKNFPSLKSSLRETWRTELPIDFDGYMRYDGVNIGIPGISRDFPSPPIYGDSPIDYSFLQLQDRRMAATGKPGTMIWIGGLPDTFSRGEVEQTFDNFGAIANIVVSKGRLVGNNLSPGYAFIEFKKRSAADAAVALMDGKRVKGSTIKVEIARSRHIMAPHRLSRSPSPQPRKKSKKKNSSSSSSGGSSSSSGDDGSDSANEKKKKLKRKMKKLKMELKKEKRQKQILMNQGMASSEMISAQPQHVPPPQHPQMPPQHHPQQIPESQFSQGSRPYTPDMNMMVTSGSVDVNTPKMESREVSPEPAAAGKRVQGSAGSSSSESGESDVTALKRRKQKLRMKAGSSDEEESAVSKKKAKKKQKKADTESSDSDSEAESKKARVKKIEKLKLLKKAMMMEFKNSDVSSDSSAERRPKKAKKDLKKAKLMKLMDKFLSEEESEGEEESDSNKRKKKRKEQKKKKKAKSSSSESESGSDMSDLGIKLTKKERKVLEKKAKEKIIKKALAKEAKKKLLKEKKAADKEVAKDAEKMKKKKKKKTEDAENSSSDSDGGGKLKRKEKKKRKEIESGDEAEAAEQEEPGEEQETANKSLDDRTMKRTDSTSKWDASRSPSPEKTVPRRIHEGNSQGGQADFGRGATHYRNLAIRTNFNEKRSHSGDSDSEVSEKEPRDSRRAYRARSSSNDSKDASPSPRRDRSSSPAKGRSRSGSTDNRRRRNSRRSGSKSDDDFDRDRDFRDNRYDNRTSYYDNRSNYRGRGYYNRPRGYYNKPYQNYNPRFRGRGRYNYRGNYHGNYHQNNRYDRDYRDTRRRKYSSSRSRSRERASPPARERRSKSGERRRRSRSRDSPVSRDTKGEVMAGQEPQVSGVENPVQQAGGQSTAGGAAQATPEQAAPTPQPLNESEQSVALNE